MNCVAAQTGISGWNIFLSRLLRHTTTRKAVSCHSYLINVQLQGASEPTRDLKTTSRLEAALSKPHFYMKPNLWHEHELIL